MSRALIATVLVVAVLVVGGVLLLTPGGPAGGASPSATVPPVPDATSVSADARVEPARTAELAAPAGAGRVTEVRVAAGDEVAQGAVLVRFDDALAAARLAEAEAGLRSAEAAAVRAEALANQAGDQVVAAEAVVDQARAAVTAADATRDALPGAASDDQERAADAEVARASAGLRAAQAQLNAARDARTAARQAAIVATAEADRARAGVAAAQAALDDLTLVAPFAGTVASVEAVVGQAATPGTPVLRLADPSGWRFRTTDLEETAVARVRLGAPAVATLDALPGTPIPSRVVSIAAFGEIVAGDVRYEVVLEPVGGVPDGLRWNMTASVTIETAGA
ncbi:MAG TPA: efflux RND transporter periplasmic adaptor subunit [Candidatus Limnocylindrales bacterium]|nr:efflux RND transporter periplasmic adaptor subunit [Candidatus Limnocylindrales bacterium]